MMSRVKADAAISAIEGPAQPVDATEQHWQSPSNEEKGENISAHSLLVHVLTQLGPKAEVARLPAPAQSDYLASRNRVQIQPMKVMTRKG
jgi:hypothetical protein